MNGEKVKVSAFLVQGLATLSISLLTTLTALIYSWPSYTMDNFKSNETVLSAPLTSLEVSLLGSLTNVGGLIATPFCGYALNTFGRKYSAMLFGLPFVVAWGVIAFTSYVPLVLVAVGFAGLGAAGQAAATVYIAEISHDSIRGTMTSTICISYYSGVLVSYIWGGLLNYHQVVYIHLLLSVVYILLIITLKESPVFLLQRGKEEEAARAIAFYRQENVSSKVVEMEISKIKMQLNPILIEDDVKASESLINNELKVNELRTDSEWKFLTSFGSLLMGALNVWPSYTSELFTSENTTLLDVPMTASEESLLGSLPSLGAMLGSSVAGVIADKLGRKHGGLAITMPFVLAWAIIGISRSSTVIIAARFFAGFSGGAFLVFAPIYISEVAESSIRGMLASAPMTNYGIGVLYSYILGWFCSYRVIIWINIAISVFGCLLFFVIYESPVYLLKEEKDEEARMSLAAYRGVSPTSIELIEELGSLKMQVCPAVELFAISSVPSFRLLEEANREKAKNNSDEKSEKEKLNIEEENIEDVEVPPKMPAWKQLFVSPSSRRAFMVVFIPITLQVLMGMVPVQVYAGKVFKEADPSKADMYSVVFGFVLVAGCITTGIIADKAGRRILIIASSAMVAICMIVLGLQLHINIGPKWVTVVMILVFCFCFMCGAGTIPYVLLTEVFSPEVLGVASMLIVEWTWFLNFLIIAIFPVLTSLVKLYGSFYIFAGFSVVNAVFSFMYVPETKGLTGLQIQDLFVRRKK